MRREIAMGRKLAAEILATLVLGGSVAAHAAVAWDEAGSGDLSDNGLSPTAVPLALGLNQVIGTMGNDGSGVDRDYFAITVPPGARLASVKLLDNTFVSGGSSFIALQSGPQVTVPTSGAGATETLMGYTHYDNSYVGFDLLPNLVFPQHGPVPLASGTYSIWIQETGGPASYGLEFEIVPGPGAPTASVPTLPEWGLLLLGLMMAGAHWRQRRAAKA
jgi:hypothetical protein